MTTSADVRAAMVRTLRRDLIGPGLDDDDLAREVLPARPSRWYLTGFLVPARAPDDQRVPPVQEGELNSGDGADGLDDAEEPDAPPARPGFLPSSMGLSFLLPEEVGRVRVTACWGDYRAAYAATPEETPLLADPASEGEDEPGVDTPQSRKPTRRTVWHRVPHAELMDLALPAEGTAESPIPNSNGLTLTVVVRSTRLRLPEGVRTARSVSLFMVNRRFPLRGRRADEASAFQVALHVESDPRFIARPDPSGYWSDDEDERLADLHYRDVAELAVGHNVSADWTIEAGGCSRICTTWIPAAIVPRIVSANDVGCTLDMATLGTLSDFAVARSALGGLTRSYREWIEQQRGRVDELAPKRRQIADGLLSAATAGGCPNRRWYRLSLSDPMVLEAFRYRQPHASWSGGEARRVAQARGLRLADVQSAWRPFQLAFLLLNLRGLVDPVHVDRKMVDLLFFPTGGGKTEAYLGLAAFTIALRRLRNPGLAGAGLTVLMRYTLRLLTLDQLQRAAGLVCAMELERSQAPDKLGTWPIEIGLWVGSGATPNRMGRKGEPDPRRAERCG